jgi:hypothetical protein
MSYLTTNQFNRIETVFLALPQTELRRKRMLQVAAFMVRLGQTAELRGLHLHLLQVLTPGTVGDIATTVLGAVSAGVCFEKGMLTGALATVSLSVPGTACWNPAQPVRITAPGNYKVYVSNNTSNLDFSVLVTGSIVITS